MINDAKPYLGYLVYSVDPDTKLHIGFGMFDTYLKAVSVAYADATTRYIPECCDGDACENIKLTSLYPLEGSEDYAFDIETETGCVMTYYILSVYNENARYKELI